MLRVVLAALVLLFPLSAAAQGSLPEKRLVYEADTDFYGEDLRAIYDLSLAACRASCLADGDCRAFTYNVRNNACFPKRGVSRREAYAGALSARVIDVPQPVRARADTRRAALEGLRDADWDAARVEAEELAPRHPARRLTLPDLRARAEAARQAGDITTALARTGEAAARSDEARDWAQIATLARTYRGPSEQRVRARALPAALNAYLRSAIDGDAARALDLAALALQADSRGRDSIPLLRLAGSLAPSQGRAAALAEAVDRYGFRIVESRAEGDPAIPRLCVSFSEELAQGVDFAPYLRLPGTSFAAEAEGRQLCLEGVVHGERYDLTLRAGLPAANGEVLGRDAALSLYVPDRAPLVRFPGRAFVLPKGPGAALPMVTVNAEEVVLTLFAVPERNLRGLIEEGTFARALDRWDMERFAGTQAEEIWRGTAEAAGGAGTLNRDVTTRLPLGEALAGRAPGLYALQSALPGAEATGTMGATQWFVVSDLGLTTLTGTDGVHVFARSLASAEAVTGLKVALISRANAVLAEVETDAQGHAVFPAGLARGTGGAAPALITAEGAEDFAFLPLSGPAFDLSDRGVEGRAPAGPIDAFLSTERGAYRAGDTIHATLVVRDGAMAPLAGLPLTAILTRPDGVEYARHVVTTDAGGGGALSLPTGGAVPRGTWQLAVHADAEAPALARQPLLVEDFLPERIDAELTLPAGPIRPQDRPDLTVAARYLFGAPGAGLAVEGEAVLRPVTTLADHPGYAFGPHDADPTPSARALPAARTDDAGRATLPVTFPDLTATGPVAAEIRVRVAEGSGRPIERRIDRALAADEPLIGVRPAFDGTLPEGAEATFDLIGVAPDGGVAEIGVRWSIDRIETRYQWYAAYGAWNWEPITRRVRVASGEGRIGAEGLTVAAPVEWGRYEMRVERSDGPYTTTSVSFDAGWYAPADSSAAPDRLEVALDRPAYRPGDTARLRIAAQSAGVVLVTVLSDRLIDMQSVEVESGATEIPLTVTQDWGAGAYVTAQLIRPVAAEAGRAPVRALGLAHAAVDPGVRRLAVAFDVPDAAPPRMPLEVALRVDAPEGAEVFATIAAVDQGILNLTGFEPPDAPGSFFGQRRLGMELRDLYGRLIDGRSGALGRIRSGGDGAAQMRRQAPPPTEELLARFSGVLRVGPDGLARTSFDLPAFNGSVRLMAVVWSDTGGVGRAEAEVLVRDPVVVTTSLPRVLAPGDTSTLRLDLTHVEGTAGEMALAVSADGVALGDVPPMVALAQSEQRALTIPITALAPGQSTITATLTTPDGRALTKGLSLSVQDNDPVTARTTRLSLAAGDTFTLSDDVFTGFRADTSRATLALGPLARIDAPGLLATLEAYPYGCTEQVTSRAMPLLALGETAQALGLADAAGIAARIDAAIATVLARQSSSGGFGLWRVGDGDLWLDAYATDFLSRARAAGHAVPDRAFEAALDRLGDAVATAPDFAAQVNGGGAGLAYALAVLAREGRARIGDLRYYADAKGGDFATPLAAAQLGAALAAYGEPGRADAMFTRAAGLVGTQAPGWRDDYGTARRDIAGLLTLAAEAGSDAVDRVDLAARLGGDARPSPQEAAWSLMAVRALEAAQTEIEIDGVPTSGPLVRLVEGAVVEPVAYTNVGASPVELTLTTLGVPEVPEPESGTGFAIERTYFTPEGAPADPATVTQGTRLVAVLTVTPFGMAAGRLMIDDPLPGGFEIDNPSLLRGGDIAALDWLQTTEPRHAEFLDARLRAAVDWRSDQPFRLAYIVRAVSPGAYHHPPALVEDMYRPARRAVTDAGRVVVTR